MAVYIYICPKDVATNTCSKIWEGIGFSGLDLADWIYRGFLLFYEFLGVYNWNDFFGGLNPGTSSKYTHEYGPVLNERHSI